MQKEGFVLLYNMGIVSQEIISFRRQAKDLPKEIKILKTGIDKIESIIAKNRAAIEVFEDDIREASLTREDVKSSLEHSEAKVSTISNNDEYDAIYKEISNYKGKIKSLSNKLNVLEEDKTKLEAETNELLEELETKKGEFAPEIKEKEKQLNSVESKISEKKAIIDDLATKLDGVSPEISKKYRRLEKRSNGNVSIGFVNLEVKSAHCSHCFSILPLQQKAILRDGTDVCICENCSSILVSSEHTQEETAV